MFPLIAAMGGGLSVRVLAMVVVIDAVETDWGSLKGQVQAG